MIQQTGNYTPEQKDEVLDELQRKSRSVRLMRNPNNISDLGHVVAKAANAYGNDDARLVAIRDAMKSSPQVLQTILDEIQVTLVTNRSENQRQIARDMFRTFYPKTVATNDTEIVGAAELRLKELANKSDIGKH